MHNLGLIAPKLLILLKYALQILKTLQYVNNCAYILSEWQMDNQKHQY